MDKLGDAHDVRDEVKVIAKEMNECVIPVNIGMRRNELEKVSTRLNIINEDFIELMKTDEDF